MSFSPSHSAPPAFMQPNHFARTRGKGGWYCTVCTPPNRAPCESMTSAAALHHEKHSRVHAQKVHEQNEQSNCNWGVPNTDLAWWTPEVDWSKPADPGSSWDRLDHADRLRLFVPFWWGGVMAALRNEEVGSMADFFERVEQKEKENPWGVSDAWPADHGEAVWGVGNGDTWDAPRDAWVAAAAETNHHVPQEQPAADADAAGWFPSGKGDWGAPQDDVAAEVAKLWAATSPNGGWGNQHAETNAWTSVKRRRKHKGGSRRWR